MEKALFSHWPFCSQPWEMPPPVPRMSASQNSGTGHGVATGTIWHCWKAATELFQLERLWHRLGSVPAKRCALTHLAMVSREAEGSVRLRNAPKVKAKGNGLPGPAHPSPVRLGPRCPPLADTCRKLCPEQGGQLAPRRHRLIAQHGALRSKGFGSCQTRRLGSHYPQTGSVEESTVVSLPLG